jgi:hypothetical protein
MDPIVNPVLASPPPPSPLAVESEGPVMGCVAPHYAWLMTALLIACTYAQPASPWLLAQRLLRVPHTTLAVIAHTRWHEHVT